VKVSEKTQDPKKHLAVVPEPRDMGAPLNFCVEGMRKGKGEHKKCWNLEIIDFSILITVK